MSPDLLAQLLEDPTLAAALSDEEARQVLVRVSALLAALAARTGTTAGLNGRPEAPAEADRLLTAEAAAQWLGVSVKWVYRNHDRLPFTRRLSRKALRFSEAGLRRWQGIRK